MPTSDSQSCWTGRYPGQPHDVALLFNKLTAWQHFIGQFSVTSCHILTCALHVSFHQFIYPMAMVYCPTFKYVIYRHSYTTLVLCTTLDPTSLPVIGEDSTLKHTIRVSHVYPITLITQHDIVHTHITHIHIHTQNSIQFRRLIGAHSCTQNHIHASWTGHYLCLPT